MDSFYQQVLGLLTTSPGNLAYHLVLAFSIAGALPGALHLWRGGSQAGSRMATGLILLLLVQLSLMVAAGLAQVFFQVLSWLPALDRTVIAFSLVLFIWLWAFPYPNRLPDFATILLGVMVVVLCLLTGFWWSNQPQPEFFNASAADIFWTSFSLLLALAGGLVMLVRHPPGYEFGLAQFVLLAGGLALHLFAPLAEGNYPGAVRLSQMAAFPLLLTLPFRFSLSETESRTGAGSSAGIQPDQFLPLLGLAGATGSQEICRSLAQSIAHAMQAENTLLLSPPDSRQLITIHCGYDLRMKDWLGSATFDANLVPVLAEALRQNRPLHLPANGNVPDLNGLKQVLDNPANGSLLAAPVASPVGGTLLAVVLIASPNRRAWSAADQNYLAEIVLALPRVLQRSQERLLLNDELTQANRTIQRLQADNRRLAAAQQAANPRLDEAPGNHHETMNESPVEGTRVESPD